MASVIVRRKLGFCRVMPFQHSGGMWDPDQEHRIPPRRGCSVLNNRTRMLLKHVVDVLDARHGPPLGKVKQLDERYPAIEEQAALRPTAMIGTSVEQLDLGTVMKASHAVAGEIVLEKLIQTLMVIALEHAGAERGLLILPHGEELLIAAEARTGREGIDVQLQGALVPPSELPGSLLHYVIRTQESVILDDASTQNLFSQDEYVRQRRPRYVLWLPF